MQHNPKKNHLLGALNGEEWQRWQPLLEHVVLPLGYVLYEPGTTMTHMYFPTTAIISLLYVMENGASAEIAVVGNDGLVPVAMFMGGARLSPECQALEGRVCPGRGGAAPAAALHTSADHPNVSNSRLQSPPCT
jgi:hypothetical protein